jgi:predicted TPR repeat methyltransferase
MAHRISCFAATLALTTALAGCATTASFRSGQQAEQQQDYDRAVAEYTATLKKHPNDRTTQLALERAKLRAAQDHFARARRFEATNCRSRRS